MYREWVRDDAIVFGWLWNSMEPHVARNVEFMKTSRSVWTALAELYSQERNVSRIYEIYEQLFNSQQGETSLVEFYGLLRGLWGELDLHQPLSTSLEEQKKQREEFRVALFLSKLNSDYRVFKDQLLAGETLPTAANAFSRLQRASLGTNSSPSTGSRESSALYSSTGGRGGRGGRGAKRWMLHEGGGCPQSFGGCM
ncbi:hypothetical protein BVC80_7347g4 [Macleaya cordata]|uniref:Retrotransposon gag domain-containing protein n=1 Tax=Macleaya cordata TaxID=56857 RepID=A0A200QXB6_MACCD|nr:hypothetical protein BVC80_7347g4 [Macleaya cordata]